MENYKIREFIPQKNKDDFAKLLPAYLSLWNDIENHRHLSFTMLPIDEETAGFWFRNHIEAGGKYLAALGDAGDILAISVIRLNRIEGCEILGLAVSPAFKRKGIGSMLVGAAIDLALNAGFNALKAGVYTDNREMLKLMINMGFIPESIRHHAGDDGRDILHLKKYI